MLDITDNLHLINVEDLTRKIGNDYILKNNLTKKKSMKVKDLKPHPCFPMLFPSNSKENQEKYFQNCKKILRKIRDKDRDKEFFQSMTTIKTFEVRHQTYLNNIK